MGPPPPRGEEISQDHLYLALGSTIVRGCTDRQLVTSHPAHQTLLTGPTQVPTAIAEASTLDLSCYIAIGYLDYDQFEATAKEVLMKVKAKFSGLKTSTMIALPAILNTVASMATTVSS